MNAPRRESYRDAPGELGIDEELPLVPRADDHGYFTLDRILGYVISSSCGAIVALVAIIIIQQVQS